MNKNILNEENEQLKIAQSLIDYHIKVLNDKNSYLESVNKERLNFIASEKLDNLEKVEIYTDINMNDSTILFNKNEIKILNNIHSKPFFARIDFINDEKEKSYYVGIKSISREDNSLMILDWRTPVCSLLYFSNLGKTSYYCETGEVFVDLQLKRQFQLEPNKIINYFDTDTKIDDTILQTVLSKNTSDHMSNIVQTIQEEQNKIIRKDSKTNVIINGVAGSGKTSIAMHRLAYLLFVNKEEITSKNILVVSPNQLFSKYISDLLPELGEENVDTYTIDELLKSLKLLSKNFGTKLNMMKRCLLNTERMNEINIKYSLDFKHYVDDFLTTFNVNPYIKNSCKEFINFTDNDLNSVKMPKYNFNIREKLSYVIEESLKNKYYALPMSKIENLTKKCVKLCLEYLTPMEIMENLYNSKKLHFGENEVLGYEDITIYAYIAYYLNNINKNFYIKHIFIDEMQDYDAFSLDLIKKLYPNAIFTIAGDYNQNIVSAVKNIAVLNEIFPNTEIDKLDISYRSTEEIVNFANNIIENTSSSKYVVRNGEEPYIININNDLEMVDKIHSIINKNNNDKFAIITKSEDEAKQLSNLLPEFTLILDDTNENLLYSKHIITTNYLSKGLEFDRVIIPYVTRENYNTEQDKYRLYVSCTRALHGLYIIYDNELSEFIKT